jgi:hypothetical protein
MKVTISLTPKVVSRDAERSVVSTRNTLRFASRLLIPVLLQRIRKAEYAAFAATDDG